MKKIRLMLIPILFILILSLGTVSASFTDLDDSSDISDLSVDDAGDAVLSDSIQKEEVLSLKSDDCSSDLLENGDDSSAKSFDDIQSAVDAASEDDTIELSGTYSGDNPVKVNKPLSFVGKGDKAVINCENGVKFMDLDNVALKFENIRFVSSPSNMDIFGDLDSEVLSFENCIFENIWVDVMFGELKVNNCLLISSILGIDCGDCNVNNSNFTKGSQVSAGKDISVLISNCNFIDGKSHAVFAYNMIDIVNCTFRNCAGDYGAAIHTEGGIGYLKNCVFINNSAAKYGGAIYCDPWGSPMLIENCSFINNSAKYGSAIAWNSSDCALIRNCIFDNNKVLGSNSVASTLYFNKDYGNGKNMSKLNITANNNFWGSNNAVLSDIFKSKNGESFKLSSVLSLRIKSNGKDSYTVYFADKSGSKVSKMPDYRVTLKDRRTGAVIAKDLLMVNGQASFKYNSTLAEDGFMILNQGGGSALKLTAKVTPTKLVTYYISGRTFNVKVVDKYNKKALSGIKLKLKVYTGKKYKMYYATTNSKGIAKFKGSYLAVGTHKVMVSASDKRYSLGNTVSSIKISKAKTVVSAPKLSEKYKKSAYFNVRVKHMTSKKYIKGLKLKLRIYTGRKYRTYTVKTNAKGIAKFNTKNLKKGTHKVKVLSGNSNVIVSKSSSIRIR